MRCPIDDLVEWDYGEFEGRTTDEIREDLPGWTIWDGPWRGGETADEVGARVDRVLARCLDASVVGDALLFAHGHVLRVLAARWLGLGPRDGAHFALGTATIGVLGWERANPVIETWNEACHLSDRLTTRPSNYLPPASRSAMRARIKRIEKVVRQRMRGREVDAALRAIEPVDLGCVRHHERIRQWVEAAVRLPARIRHQEPTAQLERRHPVADGLGGVGGEPGETRPKPLQQVALIGGQARQVRVDPRIGYHTADDRHP